MVLLIALNSKYIHTMPSLYYLKKYCSGNDISILNLNVNMEIDYMIKKACGYSPDIIGYSCYIFNIETVKKLADCLKKIFPNAKTVFGGPEAGYDKTLLDIADNIVIGEGEEAFKNYLKSPQNSDKIIYGNSIAMDNLPDIYDELYLNECKDKILYYESSRGCPFKCSYCMSSLSKKVIYKSLDKVLNDIKKIYESGIKQIKFVDRTFNSSIERAEFFFEHIIKNYNGKGINFHFEMAPDYFSEKMFSLLKGAEKGLIQFEIGVQTFNEDALKAINRAADTADTENNIKRLTAIKNIHIHTDLIAGLPLENYDSFKNSFNRLYNLKPDYIQLGFLKILKGSPLSLETEKYGIKYTAFPPYEILCSNDISAIELSRLKDIEELLQNYYNSKRYTKSIEYIEQFFNNPFEIYETMYNYLKKTAYFDKGITYNDRIDFLYKFAISKGADKNKIFDLLKSDFMVCNNNMNLCSFFKTNKL